MKRSFSTRISLYVILLSTTLFLIATVLVYRASHSIIRDEAIAKTFNQLNTLNLQMENVLTSVSTAVDNMAPEVSRITEGERPDTTALKRICEDLLSNTPHIYDAIIATKPYYYKKHIRLAAYSNKDSSGTPVSRMVSLENYDYENFDWYLIPKYTGKPYWTDPFTDRMQKTNKLCSYTHPLNDKDGNFIGVVCVSVLTERLTDEISSNRLYENSYNIVLGKSAKYIVHPDPSYIQNETFFTAAILQNNPEMTAVGKKMMKGMTGVDALEIEGIRSLIFYTPIKSNNWTIATVCPYDDVFMGAMHISRILSVIAVLAIILLAILTSLAVRKYTRPLTHFSESAEKIAQGDFNSPLPEVRNDEEMGRLYKSFSYMQESLSRYIAELKETTSVKERIESELNIAREIQMGMIPKIFPAFPERDNLDIYAILHPAKEIGGDLYDFFIQGNSLFFAIGDVSGKGVPASLLMAVTRSHFRSITQTSNNPGTILSYINSAIAETNEANMFVTFFMGILDLETGNVVYSNAGHNPPYILKNDGSVTKMSPDPNIPIGFFEKYNYTVQSLHLDKGDSIILYTDGLTEAENAAQDFFGETRVEEALANQQELSATALIGKLYETVCSHVGEAIQSDDLTVMSIKFKETTYSLNHRTITIQNEISELKRISAFIGDICHDIGADTQTEMNLELALEEIVSNIIFYAYPQGETGNNITVKYEKEDDTVTFTIYDRGVAFDPTKKGNADVSLSAEDRNIGGLGIFLVNQIMDTMEYKRIGNENILRLTRKIKIQTSNTL